MEETKATMEETKAKEVVKLSKLGYPIRTDSDKCIEELDTYYDEVLSDRYKNRRGFDAIYYDRKCVIANVLEAQIWQPLDPNFQEKFLNQATEYKDQATAYEKAVFEAISYSMKIDKDYDEAIDLYYKLLKDWPKDLASLKRAQKLCLESSQPTRFLDLVNQVKDVNKEASYFNGMLAFALLELGKSEEAETAAKTALEINSQDFLAQHCVGYALQQKCHFVEAVKCMRNYSHTWDSCSPYMRTHNWCLVAACYMEAGAIEKCYEIFDEHILKELKELGAERTEIYVDALGLIVRIHIRESILGLKNHPSILHKLMEFAQLVHDEDTWHVERRLDLLSIWALSGFGGRKVAEKLMKSFTTRLGKVLRKKKPDLDLKGKGIKLTNAMYKTSEPDQVLALLGMDFDAKNYKEVIGASDEQLEVFNEIWVCALLESIYCGEPDGTDEDNSLILRQLVHHGMSAERDCRVTAAIKRRLEKRGVPFLWIILKKSYLMLEVDEDSSAAKMEAKLLAKDAAEKAKVLEENYFK